MKLVLMSGGSGTRLWPLSNVTRSKQFLKVLDGPQGQLESMVERVWRQLAEAGLREAAYVATSREQEDILRSQLGTEAPLILEPERRDTFPAVALAAAYLYSKAGIGMDETVVIVPVDPFVDLQFFNTIGKLDNVLEDTGANLALIGARPIFPSEKYGYIVPGAPDFHDSGSEAGKSWKVDHFREKPNQQLAESLIKKGALWNCGVFAFRLGYLIRLLLEKGFPFEYEALVKLYGNMAKTSFDYEVVEKERNIVALSYEGTWKDLGNWNTLTQEMREATIGKGFMTEDCRNSHLINELDIPIAVIGIDNAVIAASSDGVIVADKLNSHRIKEINGRFDTRPDNGGMFLG